jgi:hypothetical protein
MVEFQQNGTIDNQRSWTIVVVSSADGVTGLTGQTGTCELSFNGGVPQASVNQITEISASLMPGQYYLQLDASEVQTIGMIGLYYKSAGSLAFHDRAYVSYNNPYLMQGGLVGVGGSGGASTKSGITRAQANALLAEIKKIIDEKIDAIKFPEVKIPETKDYSEQLNTILAAVNDIEVDLDPVIEAITGIPEAPDSTSDIAALSDKLDAHTALITESLPNTIGVHEALAAIPDKIDSVQIAFEDSSAKIVELQGLAEKLSAAMDEYASKLAEQSDMDKRFSAANSAMNGAMKDEKLDSAIQKIQGLAKQLLDAKFEILKNLPPPSNITKR